MYAKPQRLEHAAATSDFKSESHDRLPGSHQASSAKADTGSESVVITLLSALNSEDLVGQMHASFLTASGGKRSLDIHAFVERMVELLLKSPDKDKFPPGFATEENLLPLLCDLFSAIDSENRGNISWEELSTYLLQGAMQHSSDVKMARVFGTKQTEEISLLFKRPGGTLWLNERQWVATWDKGGSTVHLIDWEHMCPVAQLPNAATVVTVICTAKNKLAISLFNHTVVIWNTSSIDGMVIEQVRALDLSSFSVFL
jgi:hypothetical protein